MPDIQKCTLVPVRYWSEEESRCILSSLYSLDADDEIRHIDFPDHDAVLIYASKDGVEPAIAGLLRKLGSCSEHNKILARVEDGILDLVIAEGDRLLLANSYPARDFTSAEYYIFFAMKSLQLNPEVSVISICSDISAEEEMSLYRYFKMVERI